MPVITFNNVLTAGDLLTAVAFIATIVAGVVSLRRFAQTLKNVHYAELDKLYFEVLSLALDKPWLLRPDSEEAKANADAYGVYAFLMFNFLETIYDRVPGNEELCRTWYPIIGHEHALHGDWLRDPANRGRFKKSFLAFVEGEKWKKFC